MSSFVTMTKRRSLKVENTQSVLESVRDALEAGLTNERDLYLHRKAKKEVDPELQNFLHELNESIPDKEKLDACSPALEFDEFDARFLIPPEQYQKDLTHKPFNLENFMDRLASFDILKWSLSQPDCISSFHCARFGWKLCTEINSLVCVTCKKLIPTAQSCRLAVSAKENAKLFRKGIEMTCHDRNCLWRKEKTPLTILSLPSGGEMFNFLRLGAASMKLKTYPALDIHYKTIVENLDLSWLKNITGLNVDSSTDDATPAMMNQLIHFLLLNGWTMLNTTIDDGIKCSSCLRQVPLWYCKSPPAESAILDLFESVTTSQIQASRCKPFDPVNQHFWWCPWRKFLEFTEFSELSDSFNKDESHWENNSLFDQRFEDSKCLKPRAELHDYERLKDLIQGESFESHGIMSGQVKGAELILKISNIMDGLVRKAPSECSNASSRSSSVMTSMNNSITEETPKRPVAIIQPAQALTSALFATTKREQESKESVQSNKRKLSNQHDLLCKSTEDDTEVNNDPLHNHNNENHIDSFKRSRGELFVNNGEDIQA